VNKLIQTLQKIGFLDVIIKALWKLGLLKIAIRAYEKMKAIDFPNSRRQFLKTQTADLPIPPSYLIVLVASTPDIGWFLNSGKSTFQAIRSILQKNNVRVENLQTVLEFGCGCGRVLRYWHSVQGPEIHGVDYNAKLIAWCQQNLPFAKFNTNNLYPPLPYPDRMFDCVYAFSVFTHMSEELQFLWMNELARILKPGGYLLLSTHGKNYWEKLTKKEQEEFNAGHLVVRYEKASGTSLCAAFHPETYVRERLTMGYSIKGFAPAGTHKVVHQDLYLMRKD